MNYLIGFIIWWFIFGVIWAGICFFERQTKRLVDLTRKYVQMIMYMLCMLSGYLVDFILSQLWELLPEKVATFSSIAGAITLIIIWKISNKFFCYCWGTEYDIKLSDGERNWCNTISILGMVVLGIILEIENNVWDYFELTSLALSIWMGSYISIQKIQQKDTIKKVWADWKDEFHVSNLTIPVLGTIFMSMLVCFVSLSAFKEDRMIFDEITRGFAIGSGLFLLLILLKRKIVRTRKE